MGILLRQESRAEASFLKSFCLRIVASEQRRHWYWNASAQFERMCWFPEGEGDGGMGIKEACNMVKRMLGVRLRDWSLYGHFCPVTVGQCESLCRSYPWIGGAWFIGFVLGSVLRTRRVTHQTTILVFLCCANSGRGALRAGRLQVLMMTCAKFPQRLP